MRNGVLAMMVVAGLTALGVQASAQMAPEAVKALQAPIAVERDEPLTCVPLKNHMNKLAIDATLNGVTREFLFDTGSPTMISKPLAEELGLKVIGSNTGRDANGRPFTTQIALVDRLDIGGVTLRQVPVLIADFSVSDPRGCFLRDGLIGSEIFPGSVWHIDPEREQLHIAAKAQDLARLKLPGPSVTAPLIDWGYPHAPVFPYAIGNFSDNGLFDTGHSESVVLFDRLLVNEEVKGALVPDSMRKGRGSLGVSAAGEGADTDLLRFEIEGFKLGKAALGRLNATIRKAPPSLIGLGILDTHSVTLDYVGGQFRLHARTKPEARGREAGFGLMADETGVRVRQLYEASAAKRAGLELGDLVAAIDEREVPTSAVPCEVTQWIVEERPAATAQRITVLRNGQRVEIDLSED